MDMVKAHYYASSGAIYVARSGRLNSVIGTFRNQDGDANEETSL